MEVKEFFKDENIVDFDFVGEVLKRKNVRGEKIFYKQKYFESKNPIEKYIIYKTSFKKSDPDINNGLLKDIYKEMWDDEILKFCTADGKEKYYSDTMTSVQGLINSFYKKVFSAENNSRVKIADFSFELFKEMYESPSKNKVFKNCFIDNDTISNFIKHYHTLGNYIPVPFGFNKARSGAYASHDMWDITLMKIRNYYLIKEQCNFSEKQKAILELLHFYDTTKHTKEWLDKFGSWKNFVDKNYLKKEGQLDNYINDDYTIDSFFEEKHSFENPELKSKDDYLEYFEKVTKIIEDRTKIIKNVYDKKLEEKA